MISGERGLGEEFRGAAGAKGFRSARAELFRRNVEWAAFDDVSDLVAIGADDHGVEMPGFVDAVAEGTKGKIAAAAEGVEDGALGGGGEGCISTVKCGDGAMDRGVLGCVGTSGLEREGALAGCGTELVDSETLMDVRGAIEAIETGGGEDQCIGLTLLPFAEAGIDVASQFDEAEVGAQREEHGLAAR